MIESGRKRTAMLAWALGIVSVAALLSYGGFYLYERSLRDDVLAGLSLDIKAPTFTLTDQQNKSFNSSELRGKVAVFDFIYTRCGASCPMLTGSMARLQSKFTGISGLMFVSISVDPLHDRPEVLSHYAESRGASLGNWAFLTSPGTKIDELIESGFKLPVYPLDVKESGGLVVNIPHTSTIALVDQQGRIRAYFEGIEQGSWGRLEKDIHALLDLPS
jgi:protein SCO1/2